MALYIFLFFLPFLRGSIDLLMVRGYYTSATLQLADSQGSIVSSTTILTDNANYFMINDVDFNMVANQLYCIDNNFNPIDDPNY
jgi:hypothetical protein